MKQPLHITMIADPLGGYVGGLLGMGIVRHGPTPATVIAEMLRHAKSLLWAASDRAGFAVVMPEQEIEPDSDGRFTVRVLRVGSNWIAELEALDLQRSGLTQQAALALLEVDLLALAREHACGDLQLVPELAQPLELVNTQAARWAQIEARAMPLPDRPTCRPVGQKLGTACPRES